MRGIRAEVVDLVKDPDAPSPQTSPKGPRDPKEGGLTTSAKKSQKSIKTRRSRQSANGLRRGPKTETPF